VNLELDDTERAALTDLVTAEVKSTAYPLSLRLRPLRSRPASLARYWRRESGAGRPFRKRFLPRFREPLDAVGTNRETCYGLGWRVTLSPYATAIGSAPECVAMADEAVVHIGENSPEYVAFLLMRVIADVEGVKLYGGDRQAAQRQWVLDTYAECLRTVRAPGSRGTR
jgi:hypothetical protein